MLQDLKLSFAKRSLESRLAQNINLMEGHKAAGLPAGHDYYGLLFRDSSQAIQDFCVKHDGSYAKIAMGVPQLEELKHMTDNRGGEFSGRIVGIGVGIILSLVIGTISLAMCHNLYVYLTHWVR